MNKRYQYEAALGDLNIDCKSNAFSKLLALNIKEGFQHRSRYKNAVTQEGGRGMYNKILVPLDGSARAEDILPHVVELASKYQSTVLLMRVVEIKIAFDGAEFMSMAGGAELASAIEEDKKSAGTYLNEVKERLKAEGIETKTRVAFGPVVDGIILAAQQAQADLIAMASHGRTGAACVFYGCVATGVLHRVDRPLLIVRSQRPD
jgi:nucleotide-binding universal stress UspA family protein